MAISEEIVRLERRYEDLEQHYSVALNERTGRAEEIFAEMTEVRVRIAALIPFREPPEKPKGGMSPCSQCGRPFWPESLTEGRCEYCGPLGGEQPSESIQVVKRKGSRASKS